jgi:membrane carboxypeptidase/penicillin-binding protein
MVLPQLQIDISINHYKKLLLRKLHILAALPKAPSNYHPIKNYDAA